MLRKSLNCLINRAKRSPGSQSIWGIRVERKGLVERTIYPVVPPKTEYRLTPLGLKLREPISWLCDWAITNQAVLDQLDHVEVRSRMSIKAQGG